MNITAKVIGSRDKFNQIVGFVLRGEVIKPTKIGEVWGEITTGSGHKMTARICHAYEYQGFRFCCPSLSGKVTPLDVILVNRTLRAA